MKSDYQEVAILRDTDGLGLVASVTVRQRPNGYQTYSFILFKEFEQREGGETRRTSHLNERHIVAARKLLDEVDAKIRQLKDQYWEERRRERAPLAAGA